MGTGADTVEIPATRAAKNVPAKQSKRAAPAPSRHQIVRNSAPATENTPRELAVLVSQYSRDVFCTLSGTLNCLSLTENWLALSGFPAEGDVGEGFKDCIAPDHLRKVGNYLAAADTKAAPARFQVKHKGGNWRWCEMQLLEAKTGKTAANSHYTCMLRDVTELLLTQGKLEKARLEAELANKSRSEFLANMSHELRTPLNAILGFAQMIENGTYGDVGHPKYHDYVGSIQESGATLLSKINDLLEIANVDSGRMALNESSTDLVGIIRHAIEFHSHRAFCEQVTLRDRLPDAPLLAVVDRIRLLQVLTNVISNAIKYNRSGGMVDITCETRKDGGINIVVEDNGGGIPAGHLQNILSAFRQDNSFFARSRDCVGLGLALSKEIVKLHQGRITIESESNVGTLLTIRLPKERSVKAKPTLKVVETPQPPEPAVDELALLDNYIEPISML